MLNFRIGNREIGENFPVFIIAEMACGHEGNFDLAKKLTTIACEANADAIKFHMHTLDEYITPSHPVYEFVKKIRFSEQKWNELYQHAKDLGLNILAMPNDHTSLKLASRLGADAYFVHSASIEDYDLLKDIASKQKPVFLGIGGRTLEEIETAIKEVKKKENKKIILAHGYQAYPTKVGDTKLNYLKLLKDKFNLFVGFEEHAEGGSKFSEILPLMALPYGICSIEKHFTLDRSLKMVDYQSAMNPLELKAFIETLREAEKALGPNKFIKLSEDEIKYRNLVKKCIVANRNIATDQEIKPEDLAYKRAPEGVSPKYTKLIIGKKTKKSIKKDEPIFHKDMYT